MLPLGAGRHMRKVIYLLVAAIPKDESEAVSCRLLAERQSFVKPQGGP